MPTVVGVRFHENARLERYLAEEVQVLVGDQVIISCEEGLRFGIVSAAKRPALESEESLIRGRLVRVADQEDLAIAKQNEADEAEAFRICRDLIDSKDLEMQLVAAEYTMEERKLLFFFTADGRIDFRDLVRELASIFKTRIELRQIGVRDDAKKNGGVGVCGRELCCSSWLEEFSPVSIRMAKEQNISMNPTNVSGACGRLLCCLNYENEQYKLNRRLLPKLGSLHSYEGTTIRVNQQDILGLRLTVQAENPDGSWSDPFSIAAEDIGYGDEKRKVPYQAEHEKGDIPKQVFMEDEEVVDERSLEEKMPSIDNLEEVLEKRTCGCQCACKSAAADDAIPASHETSHSEDSAEGAKEKTNANRSCGCPKKGLNLSESDLVAAEDYREEQDVLDEKKSPEPSDASHSEAKSHTSEEKKQRKPRYILLEGED